MNNENDRPLAEEGLQNTKNETFKTEFKKPILIGKIGRIPRKLTSQSEERETTQVEAHLQSEKPKFDSHEEQKTAENVEKQPLNTQTRGNVLTLSYEEPPWSGIPESSDRDYSCDVLKNGAIIESINLMKRPYWVFGRLDSSHICMQHPTVSRYHAVLQYRSQIADGHEAGFYIYDLDSTHGTFLNKNRLKPKIYARVQVGHMIKLGGSSRTFILNGPGDDIEEESELTVTELKKKRAEELLRREEAALKEQKEREERLRKQEERGVDWGMGDDADEETDLAENPFAQTNNEELYLDDPKKALRGFFEREGIDLEYDCSEQGMGQFLCKVMLPLDDDRGRPIYAEVLHKGKKKEAVVQCALEACKILDRYGVLRQATHESRKRKTKNWEENDYYDSDDDTFLDRTGTIEKKRENRMKSKKPQQAETYQSLLEKEKAISESIHQIEKQLGESSKKQQIQRSSDAEEDSLDSYMQELTTPKLDKQTISKLKSELTKLKQDHSNVIKLINVAKPADLPPLVPHYASQSSTDTTSKNKLLPIFGKRKKLKVQLPAKPKEMPVQCNPTEVKEEVDEEGQGVSNQANKNQYMNETAAEITPIAHRSEEFQMEVNEEKESISDASESDNDESSVVDASQTDIGTLTVKKFEKALNDMNLSPVIKEHQGKVSRILSKLKQLATDQDRMQIDWKTLSAKRRKVEKLISDLKEGGYDEKLEHKASIELNRILTELNTMMDSKYKVINTVTEVVGEIKSIMTDEMAKECKAGTSQLPAEDDNDEVSAAEIEKKKKKNQRRIQQRQVRAETDRRRGYQEDLGREDYNMWVPPENQTGDGRTNLNDRLGY